MDISHDFLIDLALNIGGYLLAGALSVLLYSIVTRKKAEPVTVQATPAQPQVPETPEAGTQTGTRRVEFIRLGENTAPTPAATRNETPTTAARRDRSEIIRIARSMLNAGASTDRIKRVLPISESELTLLNMSKS